jgi:hypothetical protein
MVSKAASPSGDSTPSTGETPLGRRQLIAYGIQLEVFKRLQDSAEFRGCSLEDLPRLVAETTKTVCDLVNIRELLDPAR